MDWGWGAQAAVSPRGRGGSLQARFGGRKGLSGRKTNNLRGIRVVTHPAPSSPSPLPSQKQTQGLHTTGGWGRASQVFVILERFSMAGPLGNLVRTWSVSPEVRREVSLACVRPRQNGQRCEVSWVLPAVRGIQPQGRWMLQFLILKKKRFENKEEDGGVGGKRKEEGRRCGPSMLLWL